MQKKALIIVSIFMFLVIASAGSERLALEDLMKANGKAFTVLEKGIAKGKWAGLEGQAQLIADHGLLVSKEYEPPINKEQLDRFRALAKQLSQDALALKVQVAKADPTLSKIRLKEMEKTCITCHKAFVPKKRK